LFLQFQLLLLILHILVVMITRPSKIEIVLRQVIPRLCFKVCPRLLINLTNVQVKHQKRLISILLCLLAKFGRVFSLLDLNLHAWDDWN